MINTASGCEVLKIVIKEVSINFLFVAKGKKILNRKKVVVVITINECRNNLSGLQPYRKKRVREKVKPLSSKSTITFVIGVLLMKNGI